MHKVEITPAPCNVCGRGNTPSGNGDPIEFVDFERDINWNDPLILCEDCIAKAAGMVGMASKDTMKELKREIRAKERELHDARAEMDSMKARAKKAGMIFEPVGA